MEDNNASLSSNLVDDNEYNNYDNYNEASDDDAGSVSSSDNILSVKQFDEPNIIESSTSKSKYSSDMNNNNEQQTFVEADEIEDEIIDEDIGDGDDTDVGKPTTKKKGKKKGKKPTESEHVDLEDELAIEGMSEDINYEKDVQIKNVIKKYLPNDDRVTIDKMTEYEMSLVISSLATLIANNGAGLIFIKDYEGQDDPINIAKMMINQGKCPFYIKRLVGHKIHDDGTLEEYYEKWDVNEMRKPFLFKL